MRKPGRTIRDHRFGTTLDFEFLGVRKVGTNSAVGALQSSSIQQETDWLTYVGSEPCIAWKIMSQTDLIGFPPVTGADGNISSTNTESATTQGVKQETMQTTGGHVQVQDTPSLMSQSNPGTAKSEASYNGGLSFEDLTDMWEVPSSPAESTVEPDFSFRSKCQVWKYPQRT